MSPEDASQSSPPMRIFVALTVPSDSVQQLTQVQRHLDDAARRQRTRLRLTPSHQFHMTLAFLGNVGEGRLEAVFDAISAVTRLCLQCELCPKRLVALPSPSRARVIALAFEEATGQLSPFVASLHSRLRGCGCELEDRAFYAHITLARFREAQRTPVFDEQCLSAVASVHTPEVVVFRSILRHSGAEYHRLHSAAFQAG